MFFAFVLHAFTQMGINMNQEELGSSSSFLQIKELKEKVRSLISDLDLNHENTKFKHEKSFDSDDLLPIEDLEEEFIDFSEIELLDELNWLTNENHSQESLKDLCEVVYSDIENDLPDINNLCRQLESSFVTETNISSSNKPFIDSRTFTRPKKYSVRSPLTSVLNQNVNSNANSNEGRPKLQRRLTTTITPTPNLISKLEELSKSNNRPVSGNYSDANWEDGSREGLAEISVPVSKVKRQSLPASLFDRLQELKKSNTNYKVPKIVEHNTPDKTMENEPRNCMWEDAKKVKAALDIDMKDSLSSSRLSEIFRNTQDYYSDDNESFINLDEVSGFCDRLTVSTDQTTYSSIVKEMEENEICLFHRTINDTSLNENRLTFGGAEIPLGDFNIKTPDRSNDEENLLNRTYEIDEESIEEKANSTFEIKNNTSKHNVMNSTYDANKTPGLLDAVLQSDIIKNISPNNVQQNTSGNLNININNNNNNNKNNNNNNNNNKSLMGFEGHGMNRTFDKFNGTLNQNQLNYLHTEKYSTKVFDSSFRKQEPQIIKAEKRKNSFKKETDHSEDECMSTTSDHSYKSLENNAEGIAMEEPPKSVAKKQNKKLSSTPIIDNALKLEFDVVSPIRMEVGDGESQVFSNPSSRGQSPRRIPMHQEGMQKQGMPSLRQPLKVPQRELKLKPPLVRPSQTFKKGLCNARTSSEPSVPQKVETWQPVASVPVLRPAGPTTVPSLSNVRPLSRTSGIPRPPTRLKQPQIRTHYSKN